ncbi:SDR family NAD(P)-dependent oxidoreductase [Haliea sp. E17]|uniref:SDR family NAD(P)-dependent oxidoreductase n=1 Tax=Haliea sp. E17 TaxID=3401576 RepID=UPI003AAFA502
MIELNETIKVARAPGEVFDYLADFSNTPEWDATAQTASKLTPGPLREGSHFRVNCALPLGSVDLDYHITTLDRPGQLTLRGSSRFFTVTDDISLHEEAGGTRLEYRARFEFRGLPRRVESRLQAGMERMGAESIEGLRRALEDAATPPELTPPSRNTPSRLVQFTRFGYSRARKHWQAITANLAGQHALVTGASSGLGKATALALARRGAALTLVVRDAGRGQQLREEIQFETGNPAIRIETADLSLLAEVDALCERLRQRREAIDILVNNAGALYPEFALTTEGIERSTALLLLSPYRLTLGLLPALRASDGARVINIVSGGMYTQCLSLAQLAQADADDYSGAVAYAQAKRALMAVTLDWAETWRAYGIAVNAMHPGWVDTPGLQRGLPGFHSCMRWLLRSPEQGADTAVWLAAASEAGRVSGGLFLDREAQPLYLRESTRETPAERAAVLDWLRGYAPPQAGSA